MSIRKAYIRYKIDDERWLPIIYDDIVLDVYEISSYGRLRRISDGLIYKTFISDNGRERIGLYRTTGRRKNCSVHRLVANAFVVNPQPGIFTFINHINTIPTDNYYLNLEWTDSSKNMLHSYNVGNSLDGELHHFAKYSNETIHAICGLLEKRLYTYDIITTLNLVDINMFPRRSREYQRVRSIIKALRLKKFRRKIVSQYSF
jgi:hypothetical protein